MHQPVLYQEVLTYLQPKGGRKYIDSTVGAGGHAWGILNLGSPDCLLLGLDVDPMALELAEKKLASFGERFRLIHGSYADLATHLTSMHWTDVDGILLDLGVSSMQLDTPDRGFSFLADAPLDMRFDLETVETAADLVNGLPEKELARIIFEFGEEKRSRQIARAIVHSRPVETTRQLVDLIEKVTGRRRPGLHPATRTFQALRIEVNHELDNLHRVLPQAIQALGEGGRLVVIAFHSLEDRIVKQFFQTESRDCICPPGQPVCTCDHRASIRLITPKPIKPGNDEVAANPRSRSARLRVAEKILSKPR